LAAQRLPVQIKRAAHEIIAEAEGLQTLAADRTIA
jgi:hypothetical protein